MLFLLLFLIDPDDDTLKFGVCVLTPADFRDQRIPGTEIFEFVVTIFSPETNLYYEASYDTLSISPLK